MGEQWCWKVQSDQCSDLFREKDINHVRVFIKEHEIDDINACKIHVGTHTYASLVACAVLAFDRCTMLCLLREFGADLNAPCYRDRVGAEYVLDYALRGQIHVIKSMEATEFLLEHGASPFLVSTIDEPGHRHWVPGSLQLIASAKDRLHTAWAAHWALSQHPVWRDMAQQVAQCIMTTPVREFFESQEDSRKECKVSN